MNNVDPETGTASITPDVEEPLTTIVGFYPYPLFEETEVWWRHYASLAYTYGVNASVIFEPMHIWIPHETKIPVICVEEYIGDPSSIELKDFSHPPDAIYIAGNSHYRFPSEEFKFDNRVHIDLPGGHENPLYGSQALHLVLHDRLLKTPQTSSSPDSSNPPE